MVNKFISEVYSKDPETVKFNNKYVEKNHVHTEAQYIATKTLIESSGQTKPIYMLDGLCVDGRHRTKIAKELGREVLCRDINNKLTEEEIVLLCNEEVLTGRDYNLSQRAIWALNELVNGLGIEAVKAAKIAKVDKRMISYAATIKGLGREDILKVLMDGKRVELPSMLRPSSSLEIICKFVKKEVEEIKIEVDDSERIVFNPDSIIKTEAGKAFYYDLVRNENIREDQIGTRMALVELANLKFKLKDDNEISC